MTRTWALDVGVVGDGDVAVGARHTFEDGMPGFVMRTEARNRLVERGNVEGIARSMDHSGLARDGRDRTPDLLMLP